VRRVFITYRGANAAHFAERLHSDLAAHLDRASVVAGGDLHAGDVVLVVLAAGGRPARPSRLRELAGDALEDATLRGDEVIAIRVGEGVDRPTAWYLSESHWEASIRRIAAKLRRLLADTAPEAPRPFGVTERDLLGRLLEAEASGGVTRTRAGPATPSPGATVIARRPIEIGRAHV